MADSVVFLVLEYVSIVLFLYLIGYCHYRSLNYTLLIFCIVGILNNINETVLLIHFFDNVVDEAGGTIGCIIVAIFEQYLPMVLSLLASCMGFNIWFLIVCKARYVELQLLPWYCAVSFGIPLITNSIAIILLRDEPYLSSFPRQYYCDLQHSNVTFATFALPMVLGALPGIFFAVYTVVFLIRHYYKMRQTLHRRALSHSHIAMELSHCVRLIVFCAAFGIVLVMATLDDIVKSKGHTVEHPNYDLTISADFSGSLVAPVVFLIFGTTKESWKAMSLFLCYPCHWGQKRLEERRCPSSGEGSLSPDSRRQTITTIPSQADDGLDTGEQYHQGAICSNDDYDFEPPKIVKPSSVAVRRQSTDHGSYSPSTLVDMSQYTIESPAEMRDHHEMDGNGRRQSLKAWTSQATIRPETASANMQESHPNGTQDLKESGSIV